MDSSRGFGSHRRYLWAPSSDSVSSPSRGAFHLSLTVLVHYRSLKMLSLGGWSPQLPTRFLVPRGTQDASPASALARDGALTRYGGAFQHLRVRALALLLVLQPQPLPRAAGLGSSRFARHYSGNLMLISSRRATEMFQFTRCPPAGYGLTCRSPDITLEGLPHWESQGSSLACSSP